MQAKILIIAYGNPLRSDDGVAWRIADELGTRCSDAKVEIVRAHQLTPEMAETIAGCEATIFVDAADKGAPGQVQIAELAVGTQSEAKRFSHQLSPQGLMELSADLHGSCARSFSVTVGGVDFGHGEALSPVVAASVPIAVREIESLLQSVLSSG